MHEPVLKKEVIKLLAPKTGDSYLDATAGYGGHSSEILKITKSYEDSVLVDRDQTAIDYLNKVFLERNVNIINNDFYTAAKSLKAQGKTFDLILADLGVSSLHLDKASRGFSFKSDGPLDMRMDQQQNLNAEIIVNQWSQEEIERVLREYGEEPRYRKLAKAIVDNRPLHTTSKLAELVAKTLGRRPGKKHPATRAFQAVRIAVNDELGLVERALPLWVDLLNPGGKLAVITFHSLEDRIVKKYFAEKSGNRYDAELVLLNKQPIVASQKELVSNPRSRSAKLRAVANKK